MAGSNYKNYRIGSFVAVNTGKIIGCSANIHFKAKYNGSGFVFDNDGQIRHSVSVKAVKGKEKLGGFYYTNNGQIENCGFIATARGSKNQEAAFRDEILRIDPDVKNKQVYSDLKLGNSWKNDRSDVLEPDMQANMVARGLEPATEISSVDELLDLIAAVNDGDRKAAQGNYILTEDLNLRGKKIDPLGISETNPFTGTFNGDGKKITNFVINAKDREYAGFFGYVRDAKVTNLTIDYILKGTNGSTAGGMVGACSHAHFENCAVYINVTPSRCCGGFVGKNSGTIINCYVCGKIRFPIIWWPLLMIPMLGVLFLAWQGGGSSEEYVPEILDPNQAPVVGETNVPPPAAGTSRISFELNQEVHISAETQVGEMGYVNPARATMDAVVRICISDSELVKAGYNLAATGVRTAEEQAAEGYNPDSAFTELYRSGRVQIGYAVDLCKLSPLPNGTKLGVGEYVMIVMIDGYDPETNEKAIINTQVPIDVFIV